MVNNDSEDKLINLTYKLLTLTFLIMIIISPANSYESKNNTKYIIKIEKVYPGVYSTTTSSTIDSSGQFIRLFLGDFHKKIRNEKDVFIDKTPYYILTYNQNVIIIMNRKTAKKVCTDLYNVTSGWIVRRNDKEYLHITSIKSIVSRMDKLLRKKKKVSTVRTTNIGCFCEIADPCEEADMYENMEEDLKKYNKRK